jgi:glycosyltransferase involved in cell wall biosynthesis
MSDDLPKPRILLLAYAFPPDNYAGAARPERFAKYLRRLGYPVTVLAAGRRTETHQEDDVFRIPGDLDSLLMAAADKLIRIAWGFPEEGIAWIPRAVKFASRWGPETCVLFSTYPPLATHLVALALKRRYGWKWIADFRDPLAGNNVRTRMCVRWSDKILQRAILARADAVIANTDTQLQQWKTQYPNWASKFHLLWNGFDPERLLGPEPIPQRNYSVLAHVGFVYKENHPGLLLAALSRLLRVGAIAPARIRVRFVGGAPSSCMADSADLRNLANAGILEETARRVPPDEAGRIIAASDYLLLLDYITGTTGLQVPSKVFEYIRVGRPVLASTTRNSPVDRILQDSGVPYVCLYPDLSDAALDRRVLELLSLPNDAVRPSEMFHSTFDARRQADTLAQLIASIC